MLFKHPVCVKACFIIVTVFLNAGPGAGPVKYARGRLRADIALSRSSSINKQQLISADAIVLCSGPCMRTEAFLSVELMWSSYRSINDVQSPVSCFML